MIEALFWYDLLDTYEQALYDKREDIRAPARAEINKRLARILDERDSQLSCLDLEMILDAFQFSRYIIRTKVYYTDRIGVRRRAKDNLVIDAATPWGQPVSLEINKNGPSDEA